MKRSSKSIAALLVAAVLFIGLAGCGIGNDDGSAGSEPPPSQPTTVTVATGSIASDSWGYTGATAAQLTAPAKTEVVVAGRTLLEDSFNVVVSGVSSTKLSYSADATTLPSVAQRSLPGTFVSYLNMEVGLAATAQPALTVSMDVTPIPAGETLIISRYDGYTGKWGPQQNAVVSSTGTVTFPAPQTGLYGVFRQ